MKVLLCDDEPEILETVKLALEKIGCKVTTADSGDMAVEVLKENKFDAVLTDYWMKHGDGGMLARYCKDIETPCAIMTGYLGGDTTDYLPTTTKVIGKLDLMEMILPYESGLRKKHPLDELLDLIDSP